jgi:hypothetical protein
LHQIADRLGGVAYLDIYTARDLVTGDTQGAKRRASSWYRERLASAGLTACGMHLYVGPAMADQLVTLERFPRQRRRRSTRG